MRSRFHLFLEKSSNNIILGQSRLLVTLHHSAFHIYSPKTTHYFHANAIQASLHIEGILICISIQKIVLRGPNSLRKF